MTAVHGAGAHVAADVREIGLRLMMLVADTDQGVWRGVNGHLPREQARHLHRALSRDPPRESGRPALGMMADAGVTMPGKPVRCAAGGGDCDAIP